MPPTPADAAKEANEKMAKAWRDFQARANTVGDLAVRYQEHIKDVGNSGFRTMTLDPASRAYAVVDGSKGAEDIVTLTTLKYTVEIIGSITSPAGLPVYIGLHGGGGATKDANDREWFNMTRIYKGAVRSGVWVTVRGLGNSWDLHFTSAMYVLLERLIENMVLFGAKPTLPEQKDWDPVAVNSNRVYLLGFSAGGDGVYRLAGRLAQRFAAANMGGGHPGSMIIEDHTTTGPSRLNNGLRNLCNLPICLQVGEHDTAYLRSPMVARSILDLDQLQSHYRTLFQCPNGRIYSHAGFIHATGVAPDGENPSSFYHNSWERPNFHFNHHTSPSLPPPTPIISPLYLPTWTHQSHSLAQQQSLKLPSTPREHLTHAYTNPILDFFDNSRLPTTIPTTRNPHPTYLIWDLTLPRGDDNFPPEVFSSLSAGGRQNYWLEIPPSSIINHAANPLIVASICHEQSIINIYQADGVDAFRVLLRPGMVRDLTSVMVIVRDGKEALWQTEGPLGLGFREEVVERTLGRCDADFVFCYEVGFVRLASGGEGWRAGRGVWGVV
ncbi:hypothetical protein QBC34DRAFT_442274 [Podospora aff. communis PSN243]|uniref:Alpha/beta-hydrolase n=1 Tax=Podospora aff. communis PSN243 TaxID=3040156 RepID=A0AAV9G844_9PEZI|nr:hypothetical protein QBC34DRAFT_442274 [Podospora aff. communis PSN243]